MSGLDRDLASADALLTDLYLDAVLAGAVRDAAAAGSLEDIGDRLDPGLRRATDRLRRDLLRVHPSFRFEERLAARLAEAAIALRVPLAAGSEGRLVPFPALPAGPLADDGAGLLPPIAGDGRFGEAGAVVAGDGEPAGLADARRDRTRPLIIGGALTSAALSLAGAAFVAWRLGRPGRPATPMARAARAVREARHAAPRLHVPGGDDLAPDRLRPRGLD